jgi:hypothetical protein
MVAQGQVEQIIAARQEVIPTAGNRLRAVCQTTAINSSPDRVHLGQVSGKGPGNECQLDTLIFDYGCLNKIDTFYLGADIVHHPADIPDASSAFRVFDGTLAGSVFFSSHDFI